MNLVNKLFLGLAAATLVSASAFAGTVTQTIGPVSSDSYVSWTRQDLGDITLAQYTSSNTGLNSSRLGLPGLRQWRERRSLRSRR